MKELKAVMLRVEILLLKLWALLLEIVLFNQYVYSKISANIRICWWKLMIKLGK